MPVGQPARWMTRHWEVFSVMERWCNVLSACLNHYCAPPRSNISSALVPTEVARDGITRWMSTAGQTPWPRGGMAESTTKTGPSLLTCSLEPRSEWAHEITLTRFSTLRPLLEARRCRQRGSLHRAQPTDLLRLPRRESLTDHQHSGNTSPDLTEDGDA